MFNTRQALLKTIPCLSHGNTYLKHSHVLHMGIFVLLSQHLHDLFSILSSVADSLVSYEYIDLTIYNRHALGTDQLVANKHL